MTEHVSWLDNHHAVNSGIHNMVSHVLDWFESGLTEEQVSDLARNEFRTVFANCLRQAYERSRGDGYKAGQIRMQERAAGTAAGYMGCDVIGEAIRNLKLEDEPAP